jgi:predicted transglutaminase-like cysteine proteinase
MAAVKPDIVVTGRVLAASILCVLILTVAPAFAAEESRRLRLPIMSIVDPPLAYREFCQANPGHCDMTGSTVIEHGPDVLQVLNHVSSEVNAEFQCVSDWIMHGVEELWSYPWQGVGDCEDFALEKRRRLVTLGLPRAALTMAIVYHRRMLSPHTVLLVETTAGTFLVDNQVDDVLIWNETPYNFEMRERPDGKWERYDQGSWVFE